MQLAVLSADSVLTRSSENWGSVGWTIISWGTNWLMASWLASYYGYVNRYVFNTTRGCLFVLFFHVATVKQMRLKQSWYAELTAMFRHLKTVASRVELRKNDCESQNRVINCHLIRLPLLTDPQQPVCGLLLHMMTRPLTSLSLRSVLFPSTMKGKLAGSSGSAWIRNSFLQPSRAEKLALDVTSNTSMQQLAPLYRGVPRDWNLSVPAVSHIWGTFVC